MIELERVRATYEGTIFKLKFPLEYFNLFLEERRRREVEFRERHQVVQLRKQMLERLQQRDKIRQQLADNEEMLGNSSYADILDNCKIC